MVNSLLSFPNFFGTNVAKFAINLFLFHKAMRQTPNPSQARVPTPTWAGYGFSKSSRQTSSSDKGLFCDTPDSTTSVKVLSIISYYFIRFLSRYMTE